MSTFHKPPTTSSICRNTSFRKRSNLFTVFNIYKSGFSFSIAVVVNYCVAKRALFSIIDSLSKAFAWFASFLSTVTTTLNQFK